MTRTELPVTAKETSDGFFFFFFLKKKGGGAKKLPVATIQAFAHNGICSFLLRLNGLTKTTRAL